MILPWKISSIYLNSKEGERMLEAIRGLLPINLKNLIILLSIPFLTMCSSNGLVDKSPEDKKAELYYSHGTSYLMRKKYTEALSYLLKAIALKPKDSKIQNNLGMAYYFKGKTIRALEILKQSLELNPKNSDARNNLASIYFQIGKNEKAQEQYQLILKDLIYRHQYRILYNLALLELQKKNFTQAKNYLRLSLKEKNDYCPSHYQLGLISKNNLDYQEALTHFTEATKSLCYNIPASHYQIGLTFIKLGLKEKAILKFKEIIENFNKSTYSKLSNKNLIKLGTSSNLLVGKKLLSDEELLKEIEDDKKIEAKNDYETIKAPNF